MKRAILLLVDGLRPDVAEAELAAGRLPHLAAMTSGGAVGRATTAFPSTTGVAYLPFLTGCLPGRCNVPSIRWLDRKRYGGKWWRERNHLRSYCGWQAGHIDTDIAPGARTLFELIPESLALFTPITRGLSAVRDPTQRARRFWGAMGHYLQWHQPGDDLVSRRLVESIDQPWRFIFAQFPAVDGYTHQKHPSAPRVLRALARVDATIGQLRARLTARGEAESTLILLVSDHGASLVHTHLDLADWFRARDVRPLAHPTLWTRNPAVAVMVAGNGSAMLYARPDEPRLERWPLPTLRSPGAFGTDEDIVAALVREDAVAFVVAADGQGALVVVDRDGEARLSLTGATLAYQPLTSDPLGLGGTVVGNAAEWLRRTHDSDWPDAAVQLWDQFRSERTGDLVVIAREGWDFRDAFEVPEHRSGHGSLHRAHMLIPLWSNMPLPPGPHRSVDVFAHVLHWLGEPLPSNCDTAG